MNLIQQLIVVAVCVALFYAFSASYYARPAQCADYRAGEMAACVEGVAR